MAAEQSSTADYESLTKANSCTFPSRLGLTSDHTAASAAAAAAAAAALERNSYSSTSSETRSHAALDSTRPDKPPPHTHTKKPIDCEIIITVAPYSSLSRGITFDIRSISGMTATQASFGPFFLITNLCDLAGEAIISGRFQLFSPKDTSQ